MNLIKSALAGILALLAAAPASAQQFPTVPAGTVIGRVGATGDTGPSQAIPFATLASRLFGTNPATFAGPGAVAQLGIGPATRLQVIDGSSAAPVTTDRPSLLISRYETEASQTVQSGALYALSVGSAATTQQPTAIQAFAYQLGNNDACAVCGRAEIHGPTGHAAIGGFFQALAYTSGTSSTALQLDTANNTGVSQPYAADLTGRAVMIGIDSSIQSPAGFNGTAAYVIRAATAKWDVGIGFNRFNGVSPTITADIQTDSDATTILLAHAGAHTDGINLTGTGSTYSGSAFKSPGFSLSGAGALVALTYSGMTFTGSGTVAFGSGGTVFYSGAAAGGDLTGTYPNPTIANISTGATVAGTLLHTNIAAPSTPASGKVIVWTDVTDGRLHDKNASGVIGTTVAADSGTANNFLTSISPSGLIGKAQPGFSNLSGSATCAQLPALTGDISTSAGACATTLATVASAGTTGSSTAIPVVTIDAKGRTTTITTAAVIAPAGTLSGTTLNSTVVTSSLTSLGTIGTGTWQGTVVGSTYGGTGVNNGSSTITLAGNLTHAGAFARTITATATSNSTLPAGTHTLAGLDVAQTWSALQGFNDNDLGINGSTSGNLLLRAAAISGSSVIRFPNGSTDFSATGGTSQVVKQTSSGGALTVAQLAFSDISGTATAGQLPTASAAALGVARCDNVTITCTSGIFTAISAAAASVDASGSGPATTIANGKAGYALTQTASGNFMVNNQLFSAAGGFINKVRNGTFDIWSRGTSALATSSGAAGAYTADGWQVTQNGAQFTCAQSTGSNGSLFSLQCVGGTSNTGTVFRQPIESYFATPLASATITVQFQYKQDTGGSITPKLSTCAANTTDAFGTCNADLVSTSLTACASGSWCTEAYTLSASANASKGYRIEIDCNTALTAAQHCSIAAVDVRVTPNVTTGVNANPPPPELRAVGSEMVFNQRYYWRRNFVTNQYIAVLHAVSATTATGTLFNFLPMRAAPTLNLSAAASFSAQLAAGGGSAASALPMASSVDAVWTNGVATFATGLGAGNASQLFSNTTAWIDASSEL